jgi:hypothetical protein
MQIAMNDILGVHYVDFQKPESGYMKWNPM